MRPVEKNSHETSEQRTSRRTPWPKQGLYYLQKKSNCSPRYCSMSSVDLGGHISHLNKLRYPLRYLLEYIPQVDCPAARASFDHPSRLPLPLSAFNGGENLLRCSMRCAVKHLFVLIGKLRECSCPVTAVHLSCRGLVSAVTVSRKEQCRRWSRVFRDAECDVLFVINVSFA